MHRDVDGRWQVVSDGADLVRHEAKAAEEFTPRAAAWPEGVRLAAGDPETATD